MRTKQTLIASLLALTLALGWGAVPAGAASDTGNHCFTPFAGAQDGELIDLNAITGRAEAFVHPRYCPTVEAGEPWILGRGCIAFWAVSSDLVRYPRGYVPSAPTPLEDLLSKLTAKVVVDAGTGHERVYRYPYQSNPDSVIVWHWSDFGRGPSPFGDEENLIVGLIPVNPPQPVGAHTVDLYAVLSADHWDGIGTNPKRNLLRAGQSLVIGDNPFQTVSHS